MRLRFLFAVWLVCGSIAAEQDAPEPYVRFFNDSAKAVNFYVDGQFGCSVPANPEENLSYCDAKIGTGKHKLTVKGSKLQQQSCELLVGGRGGAEANLSKGERFRCWGKLYEGQVPEAKDQSAWKEYTYPNDGFAITLPSEPSPHKDAQVPHLHVNVYSSGGVTLRVSYDPNGCESQITTQTEMIEDYSSGRKEPGPVFRVDAASIRKGNFEGYPFPEYEQQIQKSLNDYVRWYCVEKRLYIFLSDWPVGPAKPASVDRIVRSFRLLKK